MGMAHAKTRIRRDCSDLGEFGPAPGVRKSDGFTAPSRNRLRIENKQLFHVRSDFSRALPRSRDRSEERRHAESGLKDAAGTPGRRSATQSRAVAQASPLLDR